MVTDNDDPDDLRSNIVFDEDFVKGAARRELSAGERLRRAERAQAEKARLASIQRADRRKQRLNRRAIRAIRRGGNRSGVTLLVLCALVAYAVVWSPRQGRDALWVSGVPFAREVAAAAERPTPSPPDSPEPLRVPTAKRVSGTAHAFISTHPKSRVPVTYDPCRRIAVVVNNRTAPEPGEQLVRKALSQLGAQAGFEFSYEGLVTEPPVERRRSFQPETYGDRWAPVLIAWSDSMEAPGLSGNVAGFAGSTSLPLSATKDIYVTGEVILDGPQLTEILARENGFAEARAVLLHELGHLIGLAHVDDASELMHEYGSRATDFGPGGLSGLAALRGSARCHPNL